MNIPSLLNLRGYLKNDSLDTTKPLLSLLLTCCIQAILTGGLLYWVQNESILVFGKVYFAGKTWSTCWFIFKINILFLTPLLFVFRKSSSIFLFILAFIPYFLLELALFQSHQAQKNVWLDWTLNQTVWLEAINNPFLKIIAWVSFSSLIYTILTLFLSRFIANFVLQHLPTRGASHAQYQALFGQAWAQESIPTPQRDIGFWLLRLAGFGYLGFWAVLAIGQLGASPWPESLQYMINMSNANPALALNTYIKEWIMIMLTFLGAYNRSLRYYVCVVLVAGHLFSTTFTLLFYLNPSDTITYRDYLLTSTFVEGSLMSIFIFVLFKYRSYRQPFMAQNDFPINFSIPMTLTQWLYIGLTVVFFGIGLGILITRIWGNLTQGFGIIFSEPDPMVGNTITLYVTLGTITFLLIKRDKLRQHFTNLLVFPLLLGAVVSIIWIIFADINIQTQHGIFSDIDWYFGLYALVSMAIAGIIVAIRQMYYRIDCGVNTLSPAAAVNIAALVQALGAEKNILIDDAKNLAAILSSVDQYIGGIKGRKRGLLNLPFGLLEHIFNTLFGMHPPFSSMERSEQRYFLNQYLFRNDLQRQQSAVPLLADLAYQIGLSLNALTMFAYYSNQNIRHHIGYVPVDARDRLQGNTASANPPFKQVAQLPKDENDPLNFAEVQQEQLVAPRVSTPTHEANLPTEVDYLIIGSGAGGATAAYRLVDCIRQKYTDASGRVDETAVKQEAAKILVIERGNRLQALQDFQDNELEMMKKIYKEGGLQQTKKFTMTLLQGECVGGTTVSNNAVCFRMPDEVSEIWQKNFDIDTEKIIAEYDQIEQELHIKELSERGINQAVKQKFVAGIAGYNLTMASKDQLKPAAVLKVNHLHNIGDGNWNLGNKRLRKRSMLETYIPWAEYWGVQVISNWTAARFTPDASATKAEYVLLRADNGEIRQVKVNKALIVAGGVIASSHFLMRSQVNNPQIGQEVSCNFGMPLAFQFDTTINAFDGEQITMYTESLNPEASTIKSGVVFETYFNPPAAFALACMPFFFEKRDAFMDQYTKLLNFGSLIGSEAKGSIQAKADIFNGQAFSWELGEIDVERIKYAIITLIKIGQAAGAKKVIVPTKPGILLDLQNAGEVNDFIEAFKDYPLQITDLFVGTAHPQGGNKMAGERFAGHRVVNQDFQLEGYNNVFVADASVFPTSINVNPQLTIMAMSSLAAKKIYAKFG